MFFFFPAPTILQPGVPTLLSCTFFSFWSIVSYMTQWTCTFWTSTYAISPYRPHLISCARANCHMHMCRLSWMKMRQFVNLCRSDRNRKQVRAYSTRWLSYCGQVLYLSLSPVSFLMVATWQTVGIIVTSSWTLKPSEPIRARLVLPQF